MLFDRKLALVGIIPDQILFSLSSYKIEELTAGSDENTAQPRAKSKIHTQFPYRCGFVAQWLEHATRIRKTLGSIPGGAALFLSDPAVSSSIFVRAEREENLIRCCLTFFAYQTSLLLNLHFSFQDPASFQSHSSTQFAQ